MTFGKKVVGDLINYIWFVELDQDLILNLDKLHGSLIRVVRLIKAMIGPFKTLIKMISFKTAQLCKVVPHVKSIIITNFFSPIKIIHPIYVI